MKIVLAGIERDGIVKLAVDGTVTSADLPADGSNPIEAVVGPAWNGFRLLIDMSSVTYMDSASIGWLLSTKKQLAAGGGAMALYGLQPNVRQIFDLLRVDRVVNLREDEAAARQAFAEAK